MINSILTYIDSYDTVRAVCGLNRQELPDETLGLVIYRNHLSKILNSISGTYPEGGDEQNLQEIFEALTTSDDDLRGAIENLSVYIVAELVMRSVGLRAYKSQTDGKANITRFSAESAYLMAQRGIQESLTQYIKDVKELVGIVIETEVYLQAIKAAEDIVTEGF